MNIMFKRITAMVLGVVVGMIAIFGGITPTAFADESNVAKIGYDEYATLADAVDVANLAGDAVEIELIADVILNSTVVVSGEVTIKGNDHTIIRADGYVDTLFKVTEDGTLTLDNVVVDGNNEWTLNRDEYMNALNSAENIDDNAEKAHNRFVTLETGAPVANAAVFAVFGNLILESGAVIQNHALAKGDGKYVISIASGATVTMDDPVLKHNTKVGSHTLFNVSAGGTCIVNDAEITDNYGFGNGCMASTNGNLYINDINFHANYGHSNGMFRVYESVAYMEVNGGEFCGNYMVADKNNNWNGMVYVHDSAGTFVMNGGKFNDNITTMCGGLTAKALGRGNIIINGGEMKGNVITTTNFGLGNDLCLGAPLTINGTLDTSLVRLFHNFTNNGTINADTIYLHGWLDSYTGGITYSGNGTVNGNIYIFRHEKSIMESGKWLGGMVTVDAADVSDNQSSLTVKSGAMIDGIQIRVLNSVASGDYLNALEAINAQAAAYIQEAGAIVKSPVLYYHRLKTPQKSNIVVTFDYNGGLDAQNWSGCQLTNAEAFSPVSPEPKKEGYIFAGWKYAVDNNPETLDMSGTEWYEGEEITESLRLVAQWTTEKNPASVTISGEKYFDGELAEDEFTFELWLGDVLVETTKNNKEDGKFTFSDLIFDVEGEYTYIVKEYIDLENEDVIFDESVYTIVIKVTTEDGINYIADVTITKDGEEYAEDVIKFNNEPAKSDIPDGPGPEDPGEEEPELGSTAETVWMITMILAMLGIVVTTMKKRKVQE